MQLFSEAISWGNKMNFSLCANMLGFCSDSHILYNIANDEFKTLWINHSILIQFLTVLLQFIDLFKYTRGPAQKAYL